MRKTKERFHIGVPKIVGTGLWGRGHTRSLQSSSEELDVGVFVLGDLLKNGVNSRVTSLSKCSVVELLESLRVEGVLEVLENESEGKDGSIIGCRRQSVSEGNL